MNGLRRIYYFVGHQLLGEYQELSNLTATLESGKYDCLTATIVYASLLRHYGFEFKIYETTYHIYMLVQFPKRQVLIEPTDPLHGLYSCEGSIQHMISDYQEMERTGNGEGEYKFRPIHREIDFSELESLYLFNKAVFHFNEQQFEQAYSMLKQVSGTQIGSSRYGEFKALITRYLDE